MIRGDMDLRLRGDDGKEGAEMTTKRALRPVIYLIRLEGEKYINQPQQHIQPVHWHQAPVRH